MTSLNHKCDKCGEITKDMVNISFDNHTVLCRSCYNKWNIFYRSKRKIAFIGIVNEKEFSEEYNRLFAEFTRKVEKERVDFT